MRSRQRLLSLSVAIIVVLFFLTVDQLIYQTSRLTFKPCETNNSVLLWVKVADSKFISGNGVFLNADTVLTAKHMALDGINIFDGKESYKTTNIIYNNKVDLAILKTEPTNNSEIKIGSLTGPYTVATQRNGELYKIFAGNVYSFSDFDSMSNKLDSPNSMIVFPNSAVFEGDSGSPLLNAKCQLVGITTGGSRSATLSLRPKSYYVNLTNEDILQWIKKHASD